MQSRSRNVLHVAALCSLIALIALCILWEWILAPVKPGGSWLVFKFIPLLVPLRGMLKKNLYTMQWSSMMILLYFAEGIVRGVSDPSPDSALLGWVEVLLTSIFFFCTIFYLAPYKKAAKQQKADATRNQMQ